MQPAEGHPPVRLQGWDLASLFVYDGPVLADVIGGYWFNGRTLIGYVDIEVGECVDFQVNGGFYPCGVQLQGGGRRRQHRRPSRSLRARRGCARRGHLHPVGHRRDSGLAHVQFVEEDAVLPDRALRQTFWTLNVQNLLGQNVLTTRGNRPADRGPQQPVRRHVCRSSPDGQMARPRACASSFADATAHLRYGFHKAECSPWGRLTA